MDSAMRAWKVLSTQSDNTQRGRYTMPECDRLQIDSPRQYQYVADKVHQGWQRRDDVGYEEVRDPRKVYFRDMDRTKWGEERRSCLG
jgi:hypothetical protein